MAPDASSQAQPGGAEHMEWLRAWTLVLHKRRWLAFAVATVCAALSAVALQFYRDRYESTARVYVDTQTVLKPLMEGLTYQPDIDQQLRMLARTLISRENVERLIATPGLDLDSSDDRARESTIRRLMAEIKVSAAAPNGNLFLISYRGASPQQSEGVVAETVRLFAGHGAGEKRRDSAEAGRFIEEQIRQYEATLMAAENRLKEFKLKNFGVSGVSTKDYYGRVATLSDDVTRLSLELSSAERTREAYRRELQSEEPQLPTEQVSRSASPEIIDLEARLDAQRKSLDDLRRRYTEDHPDVSSTRRVIAEITQELRELRKAEAVKRASSTRPAAAATSPVYQKLRISIAETEAQAAGLRSQLKAKQAQLDQVRKAASQSPQVEAELVQLNRDYDVVRKNYDALVTRRESASLGEKLDKTAHLAEFRVVEPPRAAMKAVFPSRLHLAGLVVVVSLLAGMGAATLVAVLRPTVDSLAGLRAISNRPLLGTVSTFATPAAAARQRTKTKAFVLCMGLLIGLQVAWLVWLSRSTLI
jgi:polysaccharide chain length determinant protein (PEP-CTERM system associated)